MKPPCARLAIRIRESGPGLDQMTSVTKTPPIFPLFCHYFSTKMTTFSGFSALAAGARDSVPTFFAQLLLLRTPLSQIFEQSPWSRKMEPFPRPNGSLEIYDHMQHLRK